jgi:hypothetical protein
MNYILFFPQITQIGAEVVVIDLRNLREKCRATFPKSKTLEKLIYIFFAGSASIPLILYSALKYPVTILLIFIVAVQTFSKCLVILGYEINKDYISKNLCVNRSKPSCCCKGKCVLGKKLANDESQQQVPGKGAQKEESQLQWFPAHSITTTALLAIMTGPKFPRYLPGQSQDFSRAFFQPPQV